MVFADHFGEAATMIATILPGPGKWSGPVHSGEKRAPLLKFSPIRIILGRQSPSRVPNCRRMACVSRFRRD